MKIPVFTSWLIVALMWSDSREASGQATKEPAKPGLERPKTATNTTAGIEAQFFQFGGGNLNQFITKLRDQFGKEMFELIEIRGADANRLQVPKMRVWLADGVRTVFATYNRISNEGDGFLGKWIHSRAPIVGAPVETIIFVGPKASGADGTAGIQVRAFSVRGISVDRLKTLQELINEQSRRLQEDIAERSGDAASAEGRVSVHEGTGLLIASGGKTYVELVGTLMDAFRTLQEKFNANEPPPPQPKPKVAEPR